MGLENLKSAFAENFDSRVEVYQETQPENVNDSKLNFGSTIIPTAPNSSPINLSEPILDALLRGRVYEPIRFSQNITDRKMFMSEDIGNTGDFTQFYQGEIFDPRAPFAKEGTEYTNINIQAGTINIPNNLNDPETFQSAGISENSYTLTSTLGSDLENSNGWAQLYEPNHKAVSLDKFDESDRFKPYHYGSNVDRSRLNIRYGSNYNTINIFNPSRTQGLQLGAGEPYIISRIPVSSFDLTSGRILNAGNQMLPIARAATDTLRISKFLSSPAGLVFIAKQNLNAFTNSAVIRQDRMGSETEYFQYEQGEEGSAYYASYSGYKETGKKVPISELIRVPQMSHGTYTPMSTLASISPLTRYFGMNHGNILYNRDEPTITSIASNLKQYIPMKDPSSTADQSIMQGLTGLDDLLGSVVGVNTMDYLSQITVGIRGGPNHQIEKTFSNYTRPSNKGLKAGERGNLDSAVSSFKLLGRNLIQKNLGEKVEKQRYGDFMTINGFGRPTEESKDKPLNAGRRFADGLEGANDNASDIESEKNGMPFYFKDLRDGAYIFFRAYLDSITENIVPQWAPQNYIGRSTPVYIYEKTERDLNITFKLFAQTADELNMIYKKINKLTGLCYPEYDKDVRLSSVAAKIDDVNRMKPPLCKLRLGELYGSKNNELLGFLQTISYTVDPTTPWETTQNARVPKYLLLNVSYRVIHSEVPSMSSKFYGYVGA